MSRAASSPVPAAAAAIGAGSPGAASPQAFAEWIEAAQPGERFVYFSGAALSKTFAVVAAVDKAVAAGAVLTVQAKRGAGQFDYLAIKRRNVEGSRGVFGGAPHPRQPGVRGGARGVFGGSPIHANRGSRPESPFHANRASRTDEDIGALMAVLRRLANLARPCPSNARLADMACLKDAESVRYRLGLLAQCGRISVRTLPDGQRIVTITSTGRRTSLLPATHTNRGDSCDAPTHTNRGDSCGAPTHTNRGDSCGAPTHTNRGRG